MHTTYIQYVHTKITMRQDKHEEGGHFVIVTLPGYQAIKQKGIILVYRSDFSFMHETTTYRYA